MIDDMGIFRTTIEIAPWTNHDKRMTFAGVMVDPGSEYNWMPEDELAAA